MHDRPAPPEGEFGLTVKSVIAVGSGKGGVGKSTIAASLALGLKAAGSRVGIMDADVYGPSIPQLLGVNEVGNPTVNADKKIVPVDADGIPVLSMGFMVPEGEAVIWRGPMLHGAITQFLRDAAWGDLDYLIIDMPPGTGDIALTLSQVIPLTGAVVVCTPQRVALLDAVKSIAMFRKVNIPVLGMVENMSGFICPDSDKRYDIFGSGGAKTELVKCSFLGEVPIIPSIREHGDAGRLSKVSSILVHRSISRRSSRHLLAIWQAVQKKNLHSPSYQSPANWTRNLPVVIPPNCLNEKSLVSLMRYEAFHFQRKTYLFLRRVVFFLAALRLGAAFFLATFFLATFFLATFFLATFFFATFFLATFFLATFFLATFFLATFFLATFFLATFFLATFFLATFL